MRRPVKRARAKHRPGANPSPPQMPNSNSPPLGGPGSAPGTQRGDTRERESKAMDLLRKNWVMRLVAANMSIMRICDSVATAQTPDGTPIPIDSSEARAIYSDYLKELQLDNAAHIPAARVAQLEQIRTAMARILQGDVVLYQGVPVPNVRKINWSAYLQAHREYSLIMGTHAPKVIAINTDNRIADAMNRVLQNLDPNEYERLADDSARLEAIAAQVH